jgi:hypothetical protein
MSDVVTRAEPAFALAPLDCPLATDPPTLFRTPRGSPS